MGKTKIEWTDTTWNPIRGCSRVSEGCRNCYAERMAARFCSPEQSFEWNEQMGESEKIEAGPYHGLIENGKWNGKIRIVESIVDQPLRWRKPRKVFVNSMSDLFHDGVSENVLSKIFSVMERAYKHTFQILTKRPHRMREFIKDWTKLPIEGECGYEPDQPHAMLPKNIWVGVSVEDQKAADERIPILLDTPASVRWISAEPLLERTNIMQYLPGFVSQIRERLDWVVCGGESGPGARRLYPQWVRSLRYQCGKAQVPFLFKQWGEWITEEYEDGPQMRRVGKKAAGRLLDGREWNEYPK